jgi:hypothetical protein
MINPANHRIAAVRPGKVKDGHVVEKDARKQRDSALRDKIIAILREKGEGMTYAELADLCGVKTQNISICCRRYPSYLIRDEQNEPGRRRLPGYVDLRPAIRNG